MVNFPLFFIEADPLPDAKAVSRIEGKSSAGQKGSTHNGMGYVAAMLKSSQATLDAELKALNAQHHPKAAR